MATEEKPALAELRGRGLLALAQSTAVRTDYQSRGDQMRRETPEAIIAAMYDLGELLPEEAALLALFAVLPAGRIPFATLERLLPDTPALDTRLLALAQKGWLELRDGEADFKCSPVVQEVAKRKKKRLREDFRPLLLALVRELDQDKIHEENYRHSTLFVRYDESLAAAWGEPDDDVATLYQNIGNFHSDTGDLGKAMQAYQQMADIQSALLATEPGNADFRNGLATSYLLLGQFMRDQKKDAEAAKSYFQKGFDLYEELVRDFPDHPGFRPNYNWAKNALGQ